MLHNTFTCHIARRIKFAPSWHYPGFAFDEFLNDIIHFFASGWSRSYWRLNFQRLNGFMYGFGWNNRDTLHPEPFRKSVPFTCCLRCHRNRYHRRGFFRLTILNGLMKTLFNVYRLNGFFLID